MKTLLSQVSFRDMLMQTGKRNQISQLSLGPGDFKASHNSSGQQSSKRRLDFKPKVCSYILFCILQQIKIYYKRHMSCYKTLFLPAKSISRIVTSVNDIYLIFCSVFEPDVLYYCHLDFCVNHLLSPETLFQRQQKNVLLLLFVSL